MFSALSSLGKNSQLKIGGTSVDGGNFVRRRGVGEQFAALVVNQALAGHPAHALDEAADDLPQVDARVDRAADIHE